MGLALPVEARKRSIELRPAIAKEPPGAALAFDRVEVEGCRQHGLRRPVGLGQLAAGLVGDEGGAIEGDGGAVFPSSVPMRLEAMTGIRFAAACPCITRCQWAALSIDGSCGSLPIAVG